MGYGPRFDDALAYASELHREQRRKGTDTPYVTHLLWVAATVGEHGGDEDAVIAALLHDALEDQGHRTDVATIEARFGHGVARMVLALTDTTAVPKAPSDATRETRLASWRARKEAYVAHIESAPAMVRLVCAADKLHNARSIVTDLRRIGPAVFDRFTADRDLTLWYYRAVIAALRAAGSVAIVEELARVVDEMHELVGARASSATEADWKS
ncbi:MAG: HD domain-containing protein [Deltaproteobacteria bacterium]|nr:HD domain-containing protein [Deltaproteobacteria bacterium]